MKTIDTPPLMDKFSAANIPWYRKIIQYLFLATIVLIGIKFVIFVNQLENGIRPTVVRPPGIEAFLPISSLISLKYWLVGGGFNQVHPAGLIILLAVLATAVILKRGFCRWVCPFGLLTEYLNRLHRAIFPAQFEIPAAGVLFVGHCPADECRGARIFHLQPLQHGGRHQDAAFFHPHQQFCVLGPDQFIGAVDTHSQLLVPLPVSLRRAAGRAEFFQHLQNPSQR
jgi:hypothetical protein